VRRSSLSDSGQCSGSAVSAPSGLRRWSSLQLTPDKFDNCFIAINRIGNCRQGAQYQFDQLSIARIANPDPQDRRTIVPCCPAKGKVAIFGNENRGVGNGFVPNPLVSSRQQPEIDNVNRLTAGLAQGFRQRRRKLCIDQKEQNLFRRDDGVVCLTGSKGKNRIDVRGFEIRILLKNRFSRLASRHQAKNVRDRNAQAADAWTAMHATGIDRYSLQKV
jgi:hypothetical protein